MNQKKTKKPVKKEILLILLGIFFVALFLVFMNSFYETVWERSGIDEAEEIQTYDYQYAMIVDGGNEELWDAVYTSAREQAEKYRVNLELMVSTYSPTRPMKKICTDPRKHMPMSRGAMPAAKRSQYSSFSTR